MKVSVWAYFMIVVGIIGITVVTLFQDVTTTNDQNYYLLKEITEASMLDSVDETYFITTNRVSINKEKFVEVFIRRFAESAGFNKEYNIKFHDIIEEPPKVSISVGSKSNTFSFTGEQFNIYNKIDAIIESGKQ